MSELFARCQIPLSNPNRKLLIGLSLPFCAYVAFVGYIFLHRHLRIPNGEYPIVPTGTYVVRNDTQYQIPDVFKSRTLALKESRNGSYSIVDGKSNVLSLKQGADGLYFSENFSPSGAGILPGIARNWNEGRIVSRDGILIIEGHMLQMGLMLFVVPFKDVIEWQAELTIVPNNGVP